MIILLWTICFSVVLGNFENIPGSSEHFKNVGLREKEEGSKLSVKTGLGFQLGSEQALPKIEEFWDAIGPFPSGELGADSLDAFGGVFELYSSKNRPQQRFVSELLDGGFVSWFRVNTTFVESTNYASISGAWAGFSEKILTDHFGLNGLFFSGWAVGKVQVPYDGHYVIYAGGVSSIYVDDMSKHVLGDKYDSQFSKIPVKLTKGSHTIYAHLTGAGSEYGFTFKVYPFKREFSDETLLIGEHFGTILSDIIVPDAVDGRLVSPYLSLVIYHTLEEPVDDLIIGVQTLVTQTELMVYRETATKLYPYQPYSLQIKIPDNYVDIMDFRNMNCENQLIFTAFRESSPTILESSVNLNIRCKRFPDRFRFTFPDSDGSIHKAALIHPLEPCPEDGCPVIFSTHGASVEADSDAWTYSYRMQKNAYVLLPTNKRNYGYDHEGPGYVNNEFALKYAATHLPGVAATNHSRHRMNSKKLLYSGHSMGGHGCLIHATLKPDYALGFACASGWIRRNLYIWPTYYASDIGQLGENRMSLLLSSLEEYATDYHMVNVKGVPAFLRTGTDDATVPSWQFRRVARMLNEINEDPMFTIFSEIPGQGHWFDGIVNDDETQKFFDSVLSQKSLPELPNEFTIRLFNPATFKGRAGIVVDQLILPYQASEIKVSRSDDEWTLKTHNIKRFHVEKIEGFGFPKELILDGTIFSNNVAFSHFCKQSNNGTWAICDDGWSWKISERNPLNYGPLRQVFMQEKITVVFTKSHQKQAEYLAQKLYYQGRFKVDLVMENMFDPSIMGNLVIIGRPSENRAAHYVLCQGIVAPAFEFRNGDTSECLDPSSEAKGSKMFSLNGVKFQSESHSAVFLWPRWQREKPLNNYNTGLALIIAGNSFEAVRDSVRRLVPLHGSSFNGDYMVSDYKKASYQGVAGLNAFGFWDNKWKHDERIGFISHSS